MKSTLRSKLTGAQKVKKALSIAVVFLVSMAGSLRTLAEGTPDVMPNPANGTGIYISPSTSQVGPYRGAATENHIEFIITDHTTQNLYFNFKAYNRNTPTPGQVALYYRILRVSDNSVVVGPTIVNTGAQISTYAQAIAGPNIGGATPAGYTPIVFDPTSNEHFYIELYNSTDAGLTASTTNVIVTLFDFTVATAANVKFPGRVHSKAWSFITYDPATNAGALANSLEGDFYAYTADSTVVNVDFTNGFRPFGFTLFMNKYGAVNGTNWVNDRRSQNSGALQPSLPNGYDVFLDVPDAGQFPIAATASAPVFAGKVYGCAPNLYIPYALDKPGDVAILLDINGVAGFQAGTSDRYLYYYDVPVGRNVGTWNGLDGLGNAVSTTVTFNMTLSLRRGRVNIPMYDAELNPNGMNVTGTLPLATVPRLYFDDILLANTAVATCINATTDANNNNTGGGITNADVGVPGNPGRAWDGPGSGNALPAPAGGGGSTTIAFNCDDFGNVRTLNTWFWAYERSSAIYQVLIASCSADGDNVAYTIDIDDDNDGLTDVVEGGGTDPFGDADLDGIPNALDITAGIGVPTFVDANNDGVNDNYDADLDGIVNSFDLDTDNDGIPDLIEAGGVDTNGNGRIDGTTDVNGNGLIDTYDLLAGGVVLVNRNTDGGVGVVGNTRDLDSDNDGIPDIIEAGGTDADNNGMADVLTDSDNDGWVDTYDPDDNNDGVNENPQDALIITGADTNGDGIANSYTKGDFDGDAYPNPYDLDADGDGILDVREAGFPDTNTDGIVDGITGTDGWSDTIDALAALNLINTDGVTNPDYLDIDADNDGIVDNIEGQSTAGYLAPANADSDGDGIDNNYDNNDAAFAGSAGNGITPVNTDGTDLVDYRDLDTDNDGKPDRIEGWDTNGNGAINGAERTPGVLDADNDGLLDGYDNNTAAVNPTNATTPASYPDVNNPGGDRDWRQAQNSDNDAITNRIDIDDDNDGILDVNESSTGLDPLADGDADGIPNYADNSMPGWVDTNTDGIDDRYDTDLDGVLNSLDLDSDNDGIPDIIEAGGVDINGDGRVDSVTDANLNGLMDVYDPAVAGGVSLPNRDTDTDGVPNSRDLDSDNDGIPDIIEAGGTDANNNGMVDVLTDTDGDGYVNSYDPDDNNDGLIESPAEPLILTGIDTNADGVPNSYIRGDFDGDVRANPYDLDADGDGILDVREAGFADTNNDGIADGTLGGDGWSDTIDLLASLGLINTDGVTNPDYLDIDADNDGIVDNIEGQATIGYIAPLGLDSDGDGIDNDYDNNNALFAGSANNGITPVNTDGADLVDYRDTDADNDGKPDSVEGWDTNGNGIIVSPERAGGAIDSDNDGLLDGWDNNPVGPSPSSNGTTPTSYPDVNNPGGDRDWRQAMDNDRDGIADNVDVDDDNDGVLDVNESSTGLDPLADGNGNGIPNYADPAMPGFVDNNGDGIDDRYDADGDGVLNSRDLDSDNDGIPDIIEAGGVDLNGDGRIDSNTDADNDGLKDTYDPTQGGVALPNRDTDGDGIPNSRDLDSDNDGIPDIIEAGGTNTDNDGMVDVLLDADGDGYVNAYDPDDDNNGIMESPAEPLILTGPDTNADGIPNSYVRGDLDGDVHPNPYDLDSDADGILDIREAGFTDATNNGVVDDAVGADGWSDGIDLLPGLNLTNTDGVTNPDYLDIDADNDGIVDNVEGQTTAGYQPPLGVDSDGDGIDNNYDNNDALFAGGANNGITPANTDGTDLADYMDLDTDNDEKPDAIEGWDTNGNGIIIAPERTGGSVDVDNDGLLDGWDNNTITYSPTNGTTPLTHPDVNNPGGDRDWRQAQDADNDGVADLDDLDDDNDGVQDTDESITGLDPDDDLDGDGIPNYVDSSNPGFVDTNGDGIDDRYDTDLDGVINSHDLDSDNDGIPDIIEAGGVDINGDGRVDGLADTNGNGLRDVYDPTAGGTGLQNRDTDGDGLPNSRDMDSDGDGIPDIIEAGGTDANNDGKVDNTTDTDGDGYVDTYDPDDTNDNIMETPNSPLILTGADTTGDGLADSYTKADFDRDGKPNPYDLDADADGILDVREAGLPDTNNDGIVDGTTGPDGWSDTIDLLPTLTLINTDGLTNPDYLDIDADNDGIVDNIESQTTIGYIAPAGTDNDGDGIDNAYDNNDALYGGDANNGVAPTNTDGADLADYRDLDTDNDGKPDTLEGWDTNGNGIISGGERTGGAADVDADGLLDGWDNNTVTFSPTNGTTPSYYPDVNNPGADRDWRQILDADNDGITDTVDLDDDNDGIPDLVESPTGLDALGDLDGDGIPNFRDPSNPGYVDSNGDGIDDRYDIDLDGIINSQDLDSDNDGIPDIVEAGGVDTNGDGRVDGPIVDTNGNGLQDAYDPASGGNAIANLDTDGDGIPNAKDLDSDNDGIPDVVEAGGTDANNDGKIDGFVDVDRDGYSDPVDGDVGNDGVPENTANTLIPTGADTNADGRPNSYPNANKDQNGLPNPYDLDADGDGILDVVEAGLPDANSDGVVDGTTGPDGWSDTIDNLPTLGLLNSDADIYPDYLDIDADNDGVTDNVEGQPTATYTLPTGLDSDGDGIDDAYDNNDAAFAGFSSNGITPYNHMGAVDFPDYRDTDTDDDGQLDIVEAHDYNMNGLADDNVALTGVDTDGDGLDDRFDLVNGPNVTQTGMMTNGTVGNPPTPGATGPVQKASPGDIDREWRNILSALPLKLISFTASKQLSNDVLLNWESQNEENFKGFVIERSLDGVNFADVAEVAGKGGLSATYNHLDNLGSLNVTRLYYRLRMVDNDGRFTYSRVLSVSFGTITGINMLLTPNPARENVALKVSSGKKANAVISIFDGQGKLLHVQRNSISNGDNIIMLNNIGRLPNGMYTVMLNTGEARLSTKLVIQK